MDRILRLRATHYRPPANIAPSASGEARLTLALCTVVATGVPYWRAPATSAVRRMEYGFSNQSEYVGYTRPDHDVQLQDLFVVDDHIDQVQSVGNAGIHLRSFGVARVLIPEA
jgi:phosphoribosylpyrophosphate synthetase